MSSFSRSPCAAVTLLCSACPQASCRVSRTLCRTRDRRNCCNECHLQDVYTETQQRLCCNQWPCPDTVRCTPAGCRSPWHALAGHHTVSFSQPRAHPAFASCLSAARPASSKPNLGIERLSVVVQVLVWLSGMLHGDASRPCGFQPNPASSHELSPSGQRNLDKCGVHTPSNRALRCASASAAACSCRRRSSFALASFSCASVCALAVAAHRSNVT